MIGDAFPSVEAFASDSLTGCLYIGGRFDTANGQPANNIVKYKSPAVGININPKQNSSISFYPNPVKNLLTIDLSKTGLDNVSVSLINNLGISVYAEEIDQWQAFNIDISELPKGLYFVKVTGNEGESVVGRVVKME